MEEISARLSGLSGEELRVVRDHEEPNKNPARSWSSWTVGYELALR